MLAANQVLHKGRYRIITQFGQDETGGMYEAYDTISNTNVVFRESPGRTGKIATATQLEAINAEFAGGARVLADIKHESLVSVQDYFSEIDRQYLVLESVTGHDLTSFLEPTGPRPDLAEVMSWADDLLNALHYLHRLLPPVIHRDIKPANIKLTSNLKVKLLTAGLPPPPFSDSVTVLPGQSWANASLCYKPLEHVWGGMDPASQRVILNSYDEKSAGVLLRPADARSDLYSLAASLYHVLTGTAPDDALERSIAILDGKPDPLKKPADLDNGIPPEISDALMRAMSIRRENRFDSAVIMQQVLRTASVRIAERESGAGEAAERKTETVIETAEIQLELERTMAEERQREIETEQARLDDERKRLDERRQELEAERERQLARREELEREAEQERKRIEREKLEQEAEIERKRVAQKLADLEAERSRERAEEERLEREAEIERSRAEERLQALQAEQERHRAEQKRLEEQAKAELMRAEQRIKEISQANLDLSDSADDEFPLLELEPETLSNSVVSPSGVDASAKPEPASAAASFEVIAQENSVAFDNDSAFSAYDEQTRTNWRVPIIAGAAALVIAAAVGAWQFMPSAGSTPAANPAQASFSAPQAQPQPEPEVTPTAESTPESSSIPEQEVPVDPGVQAKQPQPNPDKQKRAAPVAAKPPAPKKKVTADDLINDN